jgi:hypothetical protein
VDKLHINPRVAAYQSALTQYENIHMTSPTVGQPVHYFPAHERNTPFAAIIASVWSDSSVSLAIFDRNGNLLLNQPTEILYVPGGESAPVGEPFCTFASAL